MNTCVTPQTLNTPDKRQGRHSHKQLKRRYPSSSRARPHIPPLFQCLLITGLFSFAGFATGNEREPFLNGEVIEASRFNDYFDLLEAGLPPDSCEQGEVIRRGSDGTWVCSADILGSLDCADGAQIEYDAQNGWQCLTPSDCGTPPEGTNTVAVPTGTNLTAGDAFQWQCQSGYATDDETIAVCGSNGILSANPPVCTQVVCPSPPDGTNTAPVNAESLTEGDIYQYQCLEGYATDDDTLSVCTSQGLLSLNTPPTCTEIICGVPPEGINTEPVPIVPLSYLDIYQYQCLPDYATDDDTITVCAPDGALSLSFAPVCTGGLPE